MTRSRSTLLLLPLLVGLAACGDKDDDDTGDGGHKGGDDTGDDVAEGPHCEETRTGLAMDEASALGFSGADLAAAIGEDLSATLAWQKDGSETPMLVEVHVDSVAFVDQEVVMPDSGDVPDIYLECPDYLALAASLQLETADGLLGDSFIVELRAQDATAADFSLQLEFDDFDHPEIFAHVDTTDADVVEVSLNGVLRAGGKTSGELAVWMEGSSDSEPGDVGTAWAGTETVAMWSPKDGE
ncbi:MAG: hypothetical protein H6742_14790 [Alphaproteobacteria bacterium]|nr:hypothetical protein [Alphaproteobacteria bacterium]